MKKENIKPKQGFTIIEVVLVLAIAGLIFLMVFVALPALQRSQRDTQRRNDLSRVDTSMVQYQTNNQGTNNGSNLPVAGTFAASQRPEFPEDCSSSSACTFVRNYMNSGTSNTIDTNTFQDPDGWYYGMTILSHAESGLSDNGGSWSYVNSNEDANRDAMDHIIYVLTGAKCNGETVTGDSQRHFAIVYRLEGAGTYCIDDQ